MPGFELRHRRWQEQLEARRLDGFLINHPPNLRYLFGFTGSLGLAFCRAGQTRLIVDSRYLLQAEEETSGCEVFLASRSPLESLRELLPGTGSPSLRIGFEASLFSHQAVLTLESWKAPVEWCPTEALVEELRMIKEPEEIDILEEAFRAAQKAFSSFQQQVRPGMTEIEVAALLEFELRKSGSDGLSFETIVASGPHSARPHARPRPIPVPDDEVLLIDFGLRYRGYCSDLTRIHFWPGVRRPEFYNLVREAQEAAIDAVQPGVSSKAVDFAARDLLSRHGHGEHFGHGTGHGLGLEIHEPPRISPHSDTTLREGMVFTIEPGIYVPGECGIRIEDVVVVTSRGCRHLSDPNR